ncbi:hypothetical protein [Lactococcus formosensis]|uniref:hypothetical protein n=1 Tax=Lactococcus formosensis TaxID=1281486 RepID=UPI0031FF3003
MPEFVATEIERLKNDGAKTLSELYSADIKWLTYGTTYLNGNDLKLAEWFYDNTETFELAFIYGYIVAKPKTIVSPCPVCGFEDVENNFCGVCGHKNEYVTAD